MEISRIYSFEAAHNLPHVPPGHKCYNLHGHSFGVTVTLAGQVDTTSGWVCDFAQIDSVWVEVFRVLDHAYLNDIEGLENPTSEILARWIWQRLHPSLPQLSAIEVSETARSRCVYRGA